MISSSQRPLPTQENTTYKHKDKQTSIPQAGFEPTIPATERRRPLPQTMWPPQPALNLGQITLILDLGVLQLTLKCNSDFQAQVTLIVKSCHVQSGG